MRARVKNTKVEATYTFKILAIAEGGYEHWTGVKTMKYVCDPSTYSIQMAPDFANNLTYYKGTSGQFKSLLFSAFTTRHQYCKVNTYEIDNNNDAATLVSPSGLSWDPTCTSDHLCRNLRVTIDTATNYTFYLVVKADGNLQTSVAVQVLITCGIEQLSITKTL